MDFVLHGYCGLYCGACPIMLNTKAGAGTEQCYGCKSEQPTGYCAVCGIRDCARGKGYEFCNECSEYNTCERMQKFLRLGEMVRRRFCSAFSISSTCLRLTSRAPSCFSASLLPVYSLGCTRCPNTANTCATSLSVLAKRPQALANCLTRAGFTTATGNPA